MILHTVYIRFLECVCASADLNIYIHICKFCIIRLYRMRILSIYMFKYQTIIITFAWKCCFIIYIHICLCTYRRLRFHCAKVNFVHKQRENYIVIHSSHEIQHFYPRARAIINWKPRTEHVAIICSCYIANLNFKFIYNIGTSKAHFAQSYVPDVFVYEHTLVNNKVSSTLVRIKKNVFS